VPEWAVLTLRIALAVAGDNSIDADQQFVGRWARAAEAVTELSFNSKHLRPHHTEMEPEPEAAWTGPSASLQDETAAQKSLETALAQDIGGAIICHTQGYTVSPSAPQQVHRHRANMTTTAVAANFLSTQLSFTKEGGEEMTFEDLPVPGIGEAGRRSLCEGNGGSFDGGITNAAQVVGWYLRMGGEEEQMRALLVDKCGCHGPSVTKEGSGEFAPPTPRRGTCSAKMTLPLRRDIGLPEGEVHGVRYG
jgi:hypothetical protein